MQQTALEVGRLAEFSALEDRSNSLGDRQVVRSLVDTQLRQMGLFKELRDRLEARRALGEEMGVTDYGWLGTVYQGAESVAILREGVKNHPDSVDLHSRYMQLLAKTGRKEEAWHA